MESSQPPLNPGLRFLIMGWDQGLVERFIRDAQLESGEYRVIWTEPSATPGIASIAVYELYQGDPLQDLVDRLLAERRAHDAYLRAAREAQENDGG